MDREPDVQHMGNAHSVQSGFNLVRELVPDVVILDGRLSDDDGMAAAQRILAAAPGTRIILLAGKPTQETQRRAFAAGISMLLPEDGSLATLLQSVRSRPIAAPSLRKTSVRPPARARDVSSYRAWPKDVSPEHNWSS